MEYAFEIDDRVECILDHPDDNNDIVSGCIGTICQLDDGRIGVCWDKRVARGHDCDGNCTDGHGWYVECEYIRVIETGDFEVDEEMLNAFFSELVVQKSQPTV